jgi:hypothetical protein
MYDTVHLAIISTRHPQALIPVCQLAFLTVKNRLAHLSLALALISDLSLGLILGVLSI